MHRPTEEALDTALQAAERMRILGVDPHHLARSLLYLQQRNERLEEVLRWVDRYLRFGLAEKEQAQLRRLVQRLREEDERGGEDPDAPESMML